MVPNDFSPLVKICTKYAKICKHEIYMQNMQQHALPLLLMSGGPRGTQACGPSGDCSSCYWFVRFKLILTRNSKKTELCRKCARGIRAIGGQFKSDGTSPRLRVTVTVTVTAALQPGPGAAAAVQSQCTRHGIWNLGQCFRLVLAPKDRILNLYRHDSGVLCRE